MNHAPRRSADQPTHAQSSQPRDSSSTPLASGPKRALPSIPSWVAWSIGLLALAPLASAQPEGEVVSKNYFQMFFLSGDVLGQLIIVLLVIMSIVSISLTIYFSIQSRRSVMIPEDTLSELDVLLAEKKYRDAIEFASADDSFLGKLTFATLSEASAGYPAMERALEEAADIETTRQLRPIEYLNVLGNVSPMIGLFGTVYGMILAFQKLVESSGRPDPTELAEGISTALVTTLWGLIVAIPAIAAYTIVRNKVDALSAEAVISTETLIEPFRKKRSSSGGDRPSRPKATPQPD